MNDKILIVEGEEKLRSFYKRQLDSLGYDVITVESGDSALEKIQRELVDLVVLDLSDDSGFDYLDQLIEMKRDLKVVINTDHPELKNDFHSWAADAVVTKSADADALSDTIATILKPLD